MKIALIGDYDKTIIAHQAIQLERSAFKHSVHPLITTFLTAGL